MSRLDIVIMYGEDQTMRREGTRIPSELYFKILRRTNHSSEICQAYRKEVFGIWLPKFLEKL